LYAFRPAAGLEGTFRFVLTGGETITIRFRPADVLTDCPPSLEKMTLHAQLNPAEVVQMQPNSVASKWADVAALVMEQDMDASNEAGELVCEEFTDAMEALRVSNPSKGISLCWLLAPAEDSTDLYLVLQALPCSAAGIKGSPVFQEDNVAAVELYRMAVAYQAFDGQVAAGPVPILFSNAPEETANLIRVSVESTFKACQLLFTRLNTVEALDKDQAAEYVLHPRAAISTKPLVRTWSAAAPPDPKKARTDAAELLASTGDTAGSFLKC
jgi:hypothetical protein